MLNTLQITFRGMETSEAVEQRIRDKAAELERFREYITTCHVTVAQPHKHRHQGNTFQVRIDLHVRNGHLVVNRENGHNHSHEDVYVALRDAFESAVRQLDDHVRRMRGEVKRHSAP